LGFYIISEMTATVFFSELPLIKLLLGFKKRGMFCPIKNSWIRIVTTDCGVCSTPYKELKSGSVGWEWLIVVLWVFRFSEWRC